MVLYNCQQLKLCMSWYRSRKHRSQWMPADQKSRCRHTHTHTPTRARCLFLPSICAPWLRGPLRIGGGKRADRAVVHEGSRLVKREGSSGIPAVKARTTPLLFYLANAHCSSVTCTRFLYSLPSTTPATTRLSASNVKSGMAAALTKAGAPKANQGPPCRVPALCHPLQPSWHGKTCERRGQSAAAGERIGPAPHPRCVAELQQREGTIAAPVDQQPI